LLQVRDAVTERTQLLPSIEVLSASAHLSMDDQLYKETERQTPQSPSKMGILKSDVTSIAGCSPESLVETYFQSASKQSSGKESRGKKRP
jgi:hypothetical protein